MARVLHIKSRDLEVAIRRAHWDLSDDVKVCGSECVPPHGHLRFIQLLPVDAHVHFCDFMATVQQRCHTARHMPRDYVLGEEDATCQ